MSLIARRAIPSVLMGCVVIIVSTQVSGQQRTPVTVSRLYSGPDGQSHMGRIEVKFTPSATYAYLEESESVQVTAAQFLRLPKGKVLDWHHPALRRYVVTLRGRGEVEFTAGQKFPLTPGRIVLAEDLTGKGHITRSTGSEDLVFFIVPLADSAPAVPRAGLKPR